MKMQCCEHIEYRERPVGKNKTFVNSCELQILPPNLLPVHFTCWSSIPSFFFLNKILTEPNPPTTPTLVSKTQTTISVEWGSATGFFDGYQVYFFTGSQPEELFENKTSVHIQSTIDELLPATEYTVRIYSVVGDSKRSDPAMADFRTGDGVLVFTKLDDRSVRVQWPSYTPGNDFNHYEVVYTPQEGSQQAIVGKSAQLVNLTPGRSYIVSLYAVSNSGGRQRVSTAGYTLRKFAVISLYFLFVTTGDD